MDLDPVGTAVRRARRIANLEGATACALCGEPEWSALLPVTRKFLERHHVFGVAADASSVVALCRNCHGRVTEAQIREGVNLRHSPLAELERIAAAYQSRAVLHELEAEADRRFALRLRELARESMSQP